jgi:hypothetical protein
VPETRYLMNLASAQAAICCLQVSSALKENRRGAEAQIHARKSIVSPSGIEWRNRT